MPLLILPKQLSASADHFHSMMPLLDSNLRASSLFSFGKQNLLVEFASLKHACPEGVYVTITPGDPALWVGVIFVRKGPYAPAVLRLQISFPPNYPAIPPLVTLSTDIFHPLLTPLTTYTYTTGASDSETVSATDEERLPPGGFSLRHGFPQWFGRARRSAASSRNVSGSVRGSTVVSRSDEEGPSQTIAAGTEKEPTESEEVASKSPIVSDFGGPFKTLPLPAEISMAQMLAYVQSSFTDETILDSIPLEAAANPGAYHAWRTHRAEAIRKQRPLSPLGSGAEVGSSSSTSNTPVISHRSGTPTPTRSRRPGEWNWEGVWEERVKKGIQNSLYEAVLFGNVGSGDDMIRFVDIDAETLANARSKLLS